MRDGGADDDHARLAERHSQRGPAADGEHDEVVEKQNAYERGLVQHAHAEGPVEESACNEHQGCLVRVGVRMRVKLRMRVRVRMRVTAKVMVTVGVRVRVGLGELG